MDGTMELIFVFVLATIIGVMISIEAAVIGFAAYIIGRAISEG